MKDLADDNFKLDENGRKFFKWVENTGKLHIPQCFKFKIVVCKLFKF